MILIRSDQITAECIISDSSFINHLGKNNIITILLSRRKFVSYEMQHTYTLYLQQKRQYHTIIRCIKCFFPSHVISLFLKCISP
uniref:Uncharacterized protein n=1 Tax=Oryza brachyantha TaxID=4533 RepID=J3LB70_ORYBR